MATRKDETKFKGYINYYKSGDPKIKSYHFDNKSIEEVEALESRFSAADHTYMGSNVVEDVKNSGV